ncbi:flagellar biosynthesis protein FlhF [Alkalibacillus filiformis]|uniref:Flagellar biosynthesis protein FlhF n=1 Tax=Alkalibacillus filiformis TaxID=200990 RepID=A0ABU0DQB8_9BACI|nr:flagellar biosynthesis protein FlhF [Alkalibacillus filiformis]MDQ0350639.1 flagellar biosynthesis protein FlhF [Alkalibacillus filiformis]
MKVKKYTAPTMPEVMKLVRKELGNQAVILNSREKRSNGFLGLFKKRNIEVVAAVDPNPVLNKQSKNTQVSFKQEQSPNLNESSTTKKEYDPDLLKEIRDLKEQLSNQEQTAQYPEVIEKVNSHLQGQGVSQPLIDELIQPLLAEYYSNGQHEDLTVYFQLLQDLIAEKLKPSIDYQRNSSTKNLFLFGPTGVGKTTTLAKLAADASIKQGKDVGLITLDTYRIAAVEQLKTYAKILNLSVEVAYNSEDFEIAKENLSHKDLIFIDTPGRNFRKNEYIEQIHQLIEFGEDDELYCVLSLTSKEQDMVDIYNNFKALPINQVIFTKADETSLYGPILNLWSRYDFKIAYLTTGQDVPDDIEEATVDNVAQLIAGENVW